jgi:hypothetical protein
MGKQQLNQAGYQRKSEIDCFRHAWITTCFPSRTSKTKKKEVYPLRDWSKDIMKLNRLGTRGGVGEKGKVYFIQFSGYEITTCQI